jgi:acyl-coenzyme A thioesterase PaaI-like protein
MDSSVHDGRVTPEDGEAILLEYFAPWVRELGLRVQEVGERHAVLRLPWSGALAREGGGLSGQAMMAAADTATVIAISSARGGFVPMTTVQQSTAFQRPVTGHDVLIDVRITKLGRTLAFADITLTAEGAAEPAARASTVYAILG